MLIDVNVISNNFLSEFGIFKAYLLYRYLFYLIVSFMHVLDWHIGKVIFFKKVSHWCTFNLDIGKIMNWTVKKAAGLIL